MFNWLLSLNPAAQGWGKENPSVHMCIWTTLREHSNNSILIISESPREEIYCVVRHPFFTQKRLRFIAVKYTFNKSAFAVSNASTSFQHLIIHKKKLATSCSPCTWTLFLNYNLVAKIIFLSLDEIINKVHLSYSNEILVADMRARTSSITANWTKFFKR